MKTIFRSVGMGAALAVMLGAAAVSGLAQDPCSDTAAQDAIQNKIRETYAKDKKTALDQGKQLLEKYGTCEYSKDFVAWLTPQMPKWEKSLNDAAAAKERGDLLKRFDDAVQGKNWTEVYVAGNEFMSKYPNDPAKVNLLIPMGLIGLYESYPPAKNYKFNDDTLRYAKLAAAELNTNPKAKSNGNYGAFQFDCAKADCLSELSYAQAYITYWAKGDKKGALPLYFETIQMAGRHKDDPYGYASIGGYYADEAGKLGKQYADLVAQRKPDNTPEVAADLETKIKNTEGMLKGYLDRAIDAYSRAYNFTKNDAANKQTRDGLYSTVQNLYKLRYQKDTGINEFITATVAKPMPNPSTEVTPVIEADAATTTGGDAAAGTSVATNTGTTAAKPAATTPAKPAPAQAAKSVPTKPRK